MLSRKAAAAVACILLVSLPAAADSKLLATSGGQQFEGQAGGGLVPWAVIAGYGDEGEWGASAALSTVRVDDFQLDVLGVGIGIDNRFELSAARQRLEVEPLGLEIEQDVIAGKWRMTGDLVYGSVPAVTLGAQWKHNRDPDVAYSLGATDDTGVDVTVSVARLWLGAVAGRNVFTGATARRTRANQAGLLGFGSPGGSEYRWMVETAVAVFLDRHWAVGAEYRQKPNRLGGVKEDDWVDVFIGWFPQKRVSVIGAWTDLGDIAGLPDQTGVYLSLQFTH